MCPFRIARMSVRRIAWIVAVCYSVLQCVAVLCSALQWVAVWCSVLQCVSVCYTSSKQEDAANKMQQTRSCTIMRTCTHQATLNREIDNAKERIDNAKETMPKSASTMPKSASTPNQVDNAKEHIDAQPSRQCQSMNGRPTMEWHSHAATAWQQPRCYSVTAATLLQRDSNHAATAWQQPRCYSVTATTLLQRDSN